MRKPMTVLAIFAMLSCPVARARRTCIAPDKALQHVDENVCISAHVYRLVDAADGVHFLDVCRPQTSDADCHFFILSFSRDEKSVGSLQRLVGQDIKIRGTLNTIQGRAVVVLSNKSQLHGGKEKFHPNPRLVASFSAENGGHGFSAKNGVMGQRGVHFHHRGN